MNTFNDIIGQKEIIEHLNNAVEMNKVSHGYIFNGEELSGKKSLAAAFAKKLQCKDENDKPCGVCHSCMQFDSGNHPDVVWVTHEKENSISVDEIREQINSDILIKPYDSEYKIYIVPDAEKMTVQAQNAILKTIEEPPEYVIIILLAANSSKLLPTIISRCIEINIKPVNEEIIQKYLIDKMSIDEKTANFCAKFSMGNVGKAIKLAQSEEFNNIKVDCIHLLKYISDMQVYEIMDALKDLTKYKLSINDYLDFMLVWYRDILLFKVTKNPNNLLFRDEINVITRQAEISSFQGIEKILIAIDKAKIRLNANVNFDIAMELLLLTIKEN